MILRPVDSEGDVLPVLSKADRLSGAEAVGRLAEYRLELLQGEWWEMPGMGNPILERLREGRVSEGDARSLAGMLTEYIRGTPGVRGVTDVKWEIIGRQIRFYFMLQTESGNSMVAYSVD